MTTRRDFLRLSAAAAAAGCTLRATSAFAAGAHDGIDYGVQLYMVRKEAPKDLAGVLKKIRAIGFTQVELYPIAYTHQAAELKAMVEDAGLGHDSAHFDFDSIPARIGYAKELGLKYMVCSILPEKYWGGPGNFKAAAYNLNEWGKLVRNAGMKLVFHNHNYEFKRLPDGETGFDVLMKNTDDDLVKLEFDLYWLIQAGQDPAMMMKKYRNRLVMIHLKDRVADSPVNYRPQDEQHITELGKGSIDWAPLISQARAQGVKLAFVDQDETKLPTFEAMKIDFDYLNGLKLR
ncbi:MAG: sugar phosphate isomerase/epimerase [Edaphobacter sp.]|uniref:sugar phosphate isomerase/epimerase family protein n=1 Tax=Edaphobacter sp. TaxID=1934404 RepID=UPI0023884304|nr:sugar phosphate isomerase/epimerase [Edaphobacter sp.]MDE1178601.1 sugar phosphate isomerase/epimerase [Edaphobacter sp.]